MGRVSKQEDQFQKLQDAMNAERKFRQDMEQEIEGLEEQYKELSEVVEQLNEGPT